MAAIISAGGTVQYDWQYKDGKAIKGGEPNGPKWLVEQLGADYFDTVTTSQSPRRYLTWNSPRSDSLAGLRFLTLAKRPVSLMPDLLTLEDSNACASCTFPAPGVTDIGLAYVEELTSLEKLDLDNTKVSALGFGLSRI